MLEQALHRSKWKVRAEDRFWIFFSALGSRPVLHEVLIGAFMIVTTPVTYTLLPTNGSASSAISNVPSDMAPVRVEVKAY